MTDCNWLNNEWFEEKIILNYVINLPDHLYQFLDTYNFNIFNFMTYKSNIHYHVFTITSESNMYHGVQG